MFNPLSWLKVQQAEAHCDIPCGIYDPVSAKIAAQTVHTMVLRIEALQHPAPCAATAAHQALVVADHGQQFRGFHTRLNVHLGAGFEQINTLRADGVCYQNFGHQNLPDDGW